MLLSVHAKCKPIDMNLKSNGKIKAKSQKNGKCKMLKCKDENVSKLIYVYRMNV